jgi:hypothetical protein
MSLTKYWTINVIINDSAKLPILSTDFISALTVVVDTNIIVCSHFGQTIIQKSASWSLCHISGSNGKAQSCNMLASTQEMHLTDKVKSILFQGVTSLWDKDSFHFSACTHTSKHLGSLQGREETPTSAGHALPLLTIPTASMHICHCKTRWSPEQNKNTAMISGILITTASA